MNNNDKNTGADPPASSPRRQDTFIVRLAADRERGEIQHVSTRHSLLFSHHDALRILRVGFDVRRPALRVPGPLERRRLLRAGAPGREQHGDRCTEQQPGEPRGTEGSKVVRHRVILWARASPAKPRRSGRVMSARADRR